MAVLHANFSETQFVSWAGTWGSTEPVEVTMEYQIEINFEINYGWFEMFAIGEHHGQYYASGGIWLNKQNTEVIDYDGVYDLSSTIKDQLKQWGIKCQW